MPDIVCIFLTLKIPARKVLENHLYAYAVVAVQDGFSVLSDCFHRSHIRFVFDFLFFNADSRAEGVEFQTILSASRLSDIFFNASFCRIGRFRFGCLKR